VRSDYSDDEQLQQRHARPKWVRSVRVVQGCWCVEAILAIAFASVTLDGSGGGVANAQRSEEPHANTNAQAGEGRPSTLGEEARRLASIPYVSQPGLSAGRRTGVLQYYPGHMAPGATLLVLRNECTAILLRADGTPIHQWSRPGPEVWLAVTPLPSGEVIVVGGPDDSKLKEIGITERPVSFVTKLRLDSSPVWWRELPAHHDLRVLDDGRILTLLERTKRDVRGQAILDNTIALLSSEGRLLSEVSVYESFRRGRQPLKAVKEGAGADLFHCNSIEPVAGDVGDAFGGIVRGKSRQRDKKILDLVLVCSRHQDAVFLLSLKKKAVIGLLDGPKLSHPHAASWLSRSGTVLVFDNGVSTGRSRVREIEVLTRREVWTYAGDPQADFFTPTGGFAQRLANGNTLALQSWNGEVREVSPEGRVVWLYRNPRNTFVYRAVRLEPDFFVPAAETTFRAEARDLDRTSGRLR
jgi:hypothetical protein